MIISTIVFGLLGGALCGLAHWKHIPFFDLWTELFGDASETAFKKFVAKIKSGKRSKELLKKLETLFPEGQNVDLAQKIKVIRDELKDTELTVTTSKKEKKKEKNSDTRWIVALSDETLRGMDVKSYFEKSDTFKTFSAEQQDALVEFAKVAVEVYRLQYVAETDAEKKVLASIIIDTIKASQKEQFEEFKEELETAMAFLKNGKGSLSYSGIINEKYVPKYVLNACPECGYGGDRIYVDQKNNLVHCAACGQSYSVVKYSDPELYKRIMTGVDQSLSEVEERLAEKIVGVGSAVEKSGRDLKKEVLSTKEEVKGLYDEIDRSETEIKNELEEMKQIGEELRRGAMGLVTQQYLTQFVQTEGAAFKEGMEKSVADAAMTAVRKYAEETESKADEILKAGEQQGAATRTALLDALGEQSEKIEKETTALSAQIGLLGERMGLMYDLAVQKFGEQEGSLETIRTLVENSVQRDFLDERLQGFESRMTTILSGVKEEYDRRVGAENATLNEEILQEIVRSENYKVLGEIGTIKKILERMESDNRGLVEKIMRRNGEAMVTAMADAINLDKDVLLRMYGGGIPDKYLFNQNWGGEFNCPYCGALEARVINRMQQCRCSACGQIYYALDPERAPVDDVRKLKDILKEDFGKEVDSDPLFATLARIEDWREKHSAIVEKSKNGEVFSVTFTKETEKDHVLVLPSDMPWHKKWIFTNNDAKWVQMLIVLDSKGISTDATEVKEKIKWFSLKTVVLYSEEQKKTMEAASTRALTYYFIHK